MVIVRRTFSIPRAAALLALALVIAGLCIALGGRCSRRAPVPATVGALAGTSSPAAGVRARADARRRDAPGSDRPEPLASHGVLEVHATFADGTHAEVTVHVVRVDPGQPITAQHGSTLTWQLYPGRYRLDIPDAAVEHDPPQEPRVTVHRGVVRDAGVDPGPSLSGLFEIRAGETTRLYPVALRTWTVTGVVPDCGEGTLRLRRRGRFGPDGPRDFRSVVDLALDEAGVFVIDGVPPGDWLVHGMKACEAEGRVSFAARPFTLGPEGGVFDLGALLPNGLPLSVRVVFHDPWGSRVPAPVGRVEVGIVQRASTPDGVKIHDRFWMRADDEVRVEGLPEGTYFVHLLSHLPSGCEAAKDIEAAAGTAAVIGVTVERVVPVRVVWERPHDLRVVPHVALVDAQGREHRLKLRDEIPAGYSGSVEVPPGTYVARITELPGVESYPDVRGIEEQLLVATEDGGEVRFR